MTDISSKAENGICPFHFSRSNESKKESTYAGIEFTTQVVIIAENIIRD